MAINVSSTHTAIDDYGRVLYPILKGGTGYMSKTGSGTYGFSVAADNGMVAVGAPTQGTYGTVYVYDRKSGGTKHTLEPSNATTGARFGQSVAIGNGLIVVGAKDDDPNGASSGAAYVFDSLGDQILKLSGAGAGDLFGASVGVSSRRIVVGAWGNSSNKGKVYIYKTDGTFVLSPIGEATDDRFGYSVSIGFGRIVVGAYGAAGGGKAYIYSLDGNLIAELQQDNGSDGDNFGFSVSVGSGRVVVGAPGKNSSKGAIFVYDIDGNVIAEDIDGGASSGDELGYAVSAGGGALTVGARYDDTAGSQAGAVYRFDIEGNYIQKDNGTGASDWYGWSVAGGTHTWVAGSQDNYARIYHDNGNAEAHFEDRFHSMGRID